MADVSTEDNEFSKDLADAFAADEATENPVTKATADVLDKPAEEPKKDEGTTPEGGDKKEEPQTPPADPAQKQEDNVPQAQTPATEDKKEEPVAPQPLTKEDVTEILTKIREDERMSGQDMKVATDQVMEAYYPDGLSNVLVDQSSGKELRTPQDVVDAAGGDMSIEEATKWLMNEQYKLDQSIAKIREDAQTVAETTVRFKNDSMTVLQRYSDLFKSYPHLQTKAYDLMMKQVKMDKDKGVVLSAPDVIDLYDTYLEPYRLAFEYAQNKPSTNPAPNTPATPPPATPGIGDRMDEGGDGGTSPVDDPNDFAQQVNKELAKGI